MTFFIISSIGAQSPGGRGMSEGALGLIMNKGKRK
jgi:hypothetical protein